MQIIVQEGRAIVSLVVPVRAYDEALRTATYSELTEEIKAYYRDFELVRVELRDGAMELSPAAVAAIYWLEKGRRYQLKLATEQ